MLLSSSLSRLSSSSSSSGVVNASDQLKHYLFSFTMAHNQPLALAMTSAVLFALLAQYLLQRRKGEAAGAIGQSSAASEQGPRLDDDAPTPVDTGPSIASQSKEFGSVSASELAKHVHRDDAWIAVIKSSPNHSSRPDGTLMDPFSSSSSSSFRLMALCTILHRIYRTTRDGVQPL
mmetsp:Transcript_15904/g.32594  ORF Transcript_15904/g.32594 Transcript_15904/m.32594 type:complete len:176 (+) Transcript_15904:104-631(+)